MNKNNIVNSIEWIVVCIWILSIIGIIVGVIADAEPVTGISAIVCIICGGCGCITPIINASLDSLDCNEVPDEDTSDDNSTVYMVVNGNGDATYFKYYDNAVKYYDNLKVEASKSNLAYDEDIWMQPVNLSDVD